MKTQISHQGSSSMLNIELDKGELIVCRFRGAGKVLIQTRNPNQFIHKK